MSAMDGVSSEGACSMADPICLPLENGLAKKPAKSACCCKCTLRTGVLGMGLSLVVPTWLETCLYLFLVFVSEKGKGIFFMLFASIGAASAIMSYALWQVYQRNLKGGRCLFRFTAFVIFCVLVIMVTMPLWVDGICQSVERGAEEAEAIDCAKPSPTGQLCPGGNMTCGLPIIAMARMTGCKLNVAEAQLAGCDTCYNLPECVPATTGCEVNADVLAEHERVEPECYSALLNVEASAMLFSLLYCSYYLYICNSYVLAFEENEGRSMMEGDVEGKANPSAEGGAPP